MYWFQRDTTLQQDAKLLSDLGASKGGIARAKLPKKELSMIGKAGAKARWKPMPARSSKRKRG